MPFFSIIIPTYNRATFLERAIKSVLFQEYIDWELLIIDDASTDNTAEIVASIKDERIRYCKNEKNLERSASRNKGIDLSRGEFICFLDSDDAYRKNHLSSFYAFIEINKDFIGILYSGFQRNYSDGQTEIINESPAKNENVIEWIIQKQLPPPSSVCVPKEILQQYLFNTSIHINEDIELWVRIATKYPIQSITEVSLDFYIHGENTFCTQKIPRKDEIFVLKTICRNPICKNHLSKSFKRKRLQELRSQQIIIMISDKIGNANPYILRYLMRYPFSFQNKHRIYVLLENVTLFKALVALYSMIKKTLKSNN